MSFQQAIQILKNLPEAYQKEVLNFIEFIAQKNQREPMALAQPSKRGGFGSLKGTIWMSPDFDELLDDFEDYR
ncbi:MAG: DUF2281 domain-containing protein [Bacteroidota bacterium]